jgi:cysteine-rich repeat protein
MSSPFRVSALALALVLFRGLPAMATTVDDVCTGDPCVLAKTVDVTVGSNLDFGERAFRIAPNGRLSLSDGDSLTIHARTVTLQPGAIIRAKPVTPIVGVNIRIEATADILIQRSATPARVEAHGQNAGGSIELDAGGNIDLAGSLRADGTSAEASAGAVDILADGGLTMTNGEIKINGLQLADGGIVTITTGGAMVVGRIDASGGASGGSIELTSAGGINTTDLLSVAGTAAGSSGGDAALVANGGSVFVGGRLTAQAEGSTEGGDAGEIDITAHDNVQVFGRIDAFAGGPGGLGGGITITAGADLRQSEAIAAHGITGADGGSVELSAAGLLALDALIDVHGVGAGIVFGGAGGQVRARGEIDADGENGDIHLTTRATPPTKVLGPVVVSGDLRARASADSASGLIRIEGCDVTVDAAAQLATLGSGALNQLKAGRQMSVAGELLAGPPGTNSFQYLTPPGLVPTIDPGANIQPPPTIEAVGDLLPCGDAPPPPGCPNGMIDSGEECDDGNTIACDGCSATCTREACGNGMMECEACDDGNDVDGDGCDANCTPTACGNGRITAGEACDDGNVVDGDGCDANCTRTGCGNGRITAGEACDDGNTTPGDGCDASCHIEAPPTCGNNVIDEGEDCDGGNTTDCDGDGCSHLCLKEECGNNRLECAEVCDDGGTAPCDGDCAADCSHRVSCGDGIAECTELCDAGANNGAPGSGCDTSCRVCAIGSGADCPCETDFDCSPSGRCAGLACVDGVCTSVEVRQCSDGNACNGVETCSNGECGTGTALQCADADPCTADSCNPAVGCLHTLATGIPSIACRVEALRLALAAAPDQVQQKLHARLEKGAEKLQATVDAAAVTSDNAKLSRLLKKAAKRAKKLIRLIDKGVRKNQLPATLADTLRAAAAGAQAAAQEIRGSLLT